MFVRISRQKIGISQRIVQRSALICACLCLLVLMGSVQPAAASAQTTRPTVIRETATLVATKDNTLYESESGDISNGAGEYLFAGQTSGGAARRGLLVFDIASALPGDAMITGASLSLTMNKTRAGEKDVSLHRLTGDWGESTSNADGDEGRGATAAEGDATWQHRFYITDTWTAPGGDFAADASATTAISGSGVYTWTSAAMVADVQAWLDNPESNDGWLLKGDESSTKTAKRFASREHPEPAARPTLRIEYELSGSRRIFLPRIETP